MIVIGDIHAKNKEPYKTAISQFFKWLVENYKNETIVQLGDLFDTSTPHAEIESEIVHYLVQFKQVYILKGNHDTSSKSGNTLLPFNAHKNIKVFSEQEEIEIEGHKCLMLPHVYDKKYDDIEWQGDFVFIHCPDKKNQFADEGLSLSKIKATKLWGHIHIHSVYDDNIIVGTPIKSRHLEEDNKIIQIDSNKNITYIDHPTYFEFQTLEYPQLPENKNNILNIINAPSSKAVYETYKGYFIRDEGIELLRTENEQSLEDMKKTFDDMNLVHAFSEYSTNENIVLKKEIYDEGILRLSKVIV